MSSLILSYFGYVSFNMDMFVDIDDTPQQPRSFVRPIRYYFGNDLCSSQILSLAYKISLNTVTLPFSREVRKLDGGSSNLV